MLASLTVSCVHSLPKRTRGRMARFMCKTHRIGVQTVRGDRGIGALSEMQHRVELSQQEPPRLPTNYFLHPFFVSKPFHLVLDSSLTKSLPSVLSPVTKKFDDWPVRCKVDIIAWREKSYNFMKNFTSSRALPVVTAQSSHNTLLPDYTQDQYIVQIHTLTARGD